MRPIGNLLSLIQERPANIFFYTCIYFYYIICVNFLAQCFYSKSVFFTHCWWYYTCYFPSHHLVPCGKVLTLPSSLKIKYNLLVLVKSLDQIYLSTKCYSFLLFSRLSFKIVIKQFSQICDCQLDKPVAAFKISIISLKIISNHIYAKQSFAATYFIFYCYNKIILTIQLSWYSSSFCKAIKSCVIKITIKTIIVNYTKICRRRIVISCVISSNV